MVDDRRPFAVEVCAGSARLSASLAQVGFHAVGLDYAANKDVPEARIVNIDLTTTAGEELLKRLLDHPLLAFVHFARPAAQPPELGRSGFQGCRRWPPTLTVH